jgi:hypothetical protein
VDRTSEHNNDIRNDIRTDSHNYIRNDIRNTRQPKPIVLEAHALQRQSKRTTLIEKNEHKHHP